MPEVNTPTEAQVKSISPDSALQDALTPLVTINIEIAGAYLYAKLTRYVTPVATAWTAFNRMWALLAAAFILTPVYPESEDGEEKNRYQSIVDAWLEGINDPNNMFTDDAGNDLALKTKSSDSCPESSTQDKLPMFYRPTEAAVTGEALELTQDTADTGIVEKTGEDNY